MQELLSEQGREGWELVSIIPNALGDEKEWSVGVFSDPAPVLPENDESPQEGWRNSKRPRHPLENPEPLSGCRGINGWCDHHAFRTIFEDADGRSEVVVARAERAGSDRIARIFG